jgi:MmyB-like transcription regulator ligand binding domain
VTWSSAKTATAAAWRSRNAVPATSPSRTSRSRGRGDVVVPLRLRHGGRELSFLSIVASFGTPLDVTVAELAIESFFPADRATSSALRDLAAGGPPGVGPTG